MFTEVKKKKNTHTHTHIYKETPPDVYWFQDKLISSEKVKTPHNYFTNSHTYFTKINLANIMNDFNQSITLHEYLCLTILNIGRRLLPDDQLDDWIMGGGGVIFHCFAEALVTFPFRM